METEDIIYADGEEIVVTDSKLQVNRSSYRISRITRLRFLTIPAERIPGVILFITGFSMSVAGMMEAFTVKYHATIQAGQLNQAAASIGFILLTTGLALFIMARERYSLKITTEEGEKAVLVSHKREYVTRIIEALNIAFYHNGGKLRRWNSQRLDDWRVRKMKKELSTA